MIENINIEFIDLRDDAERISIDKNIESIRTEILKSGLLVPVVLEKRNEKYKIISGFKRIKILFEAGETTIPAIIKKFRNNNERIKFIIEDNFRYRKLYHSEISKSVLLLSRNNFTEDELVAILKIPKGYINNYSLLPLLNNETVNYIDDEILSIRFVKRYLFFQNKDLNEIIFFLAQYKANANTQGAIFEYLQEIIIRDKLKKEGLYKIINLEQINNNEKLNNIQKIEKLRCLIYTLRFPKISQTEELFRKLSSKYFKNCKCKIIPPLNFEGDYIKLDIKLKKEEELKNLIEALEDFKRDNGLEKLKKSFI